MEFSLVLYRNFSPEFREGDIIFIDPDAKILVGDYVLNPETKDNFVVMEIKKILDKSEIKQGVQCKINRSGL
jgi:hypothetical protein